MTQSSSFFSNQNYLTDVGAFTNSASFYGTFDQSGNVYQWNDLDGSSGSSRGLRGGSRDGAAFYLLSSARLSSSASSANSVIGFRLAAVPEPASLGLAATGGLPALGWTMLRRRSHWVRSPPVLGLPRARFVPEKFGLRPIRPSAQVTAVDSSQAAVDSSHFA